MTALFPPTDSILRRHFWPDRRQRRASSLAGGLRSASASRAIARKPPERSAGAGSAADACPWGGEKDARTGHPARRSTEPATDPGLVGW